MSGQATTEIPSITTEQAEQIIKDFVNSTEDTKFMRDYQTRFLLGAGAAKLVKFAYAVAMRDTASDRTAGENIKDFWKCKADGQE